MIRKFRIYHFFILISLVLLTYEQSQQQNTLSISKQQINYKSSLSKENNQQGSSSFTLRQLQQQNKTTSKCKIQNCQSCVKNTLSKYLCQTCIQGYFLKSLNKCQKCQVINCLQCNTKITCQKCQQGYIMQINIKGTVKCTQKQCPNNMFLNGSLCYCPLQTYQNLQQRSCIPCSIKNCLHCNATNCLECRFNYYLGSNNSRNLSSENNQSQQVCLPCTGNCSVCSSPTSCDKCKNGFYMLMGPKNVRKCLPLQNLKQIDKYKDSNNPYQNGISCTAHCSMCKVSSTCIKCQHLYTLTDQDQCVPCPQQCLKCQYRQNQTLVDNRLICIQCIDEYFLMNKTCVYCTLKNCLQCQDHTGKCLTCVNGFHLKYGICETCKQNCLVCSSQSMCLQCEYGFALQQNGNCYECLADCEVCNPLALNQCLPTCDVGTYMSVNQLACEPCKNDCLYCTNESQCLQCKIGFSLKNRHCYLECEQGCMICNPTNISICTSCMQGYKLQPHSSKCLPDVSCNQLSICRTCPPHYILNGPNCLKCKTGCQECQKCDWRNLTLCSKCINGFYLQIDDKSANDTSCQKCSQNCIKCIDQKECQRCSAGYYLWEGLISIKNGQKSTQSQSQLIPEDQLEIKCLKCGQKCTYCTQYQGQCLSCEVQYELNLQLNRCMPKARFYLTLKLDLNKLQQFVSHKNLIKIALIQYFSEDNRDDQDFVIIRKVTNQMQIDIQVIIPKGHNEEMIGRKILVELEKTMTIANNVKIIRIKRFQYENTEGNIMKILVQEMKDGRDNKNMSSKESQQNKNNNKSSQTDTNVENNANNANSENIANNTNVINNSEISKQNQKSKNEIVQTTQTKTNSNNSTVIEQKAQVDQKQQSNTNQINTNQQSLKQVDQPDISPHSSLQSQQATSSPTNIDLSKYQLEILIIVVALLLILSVIIIVLYMKLNNLKKGNQSLHQQNNHPQINQQVQQIPQTQTGIMKDHQLSNPRQGSRKSTRNRRTINRPYIELQKTKQAQINKNININKNRDQNKKYSLKQKPQSLNHISDQIEGERQQSRQEPQYSKRNAQDKLKQLKTISFIPRNQQDPCSINQHNNISVSHQPIKTSQQHL